MPMYKKTQPSRKRILVGIPYTGLIRAEWMIARYSQVIPCNWAQTDLIRWIDPYSPLGYMVADARNVIVHEFMQDDYDWLFFIDHDVVLPLGTILKMNEYMIKPVAPLLSGLYFTKGVPSEPLVYRKRGTGYYADWELGEKIWVDGVPMGCTLIHRSIIEVLHKEAQEYNVEGRNIKKVFETPARSVLDPETMSWDNSSGTEDLELCSRIIEHDILEKAGWKELAKKEFPFMIDTSIFCKHIDMSGIQYPSMKEEFEFVKDKIKAKTKEDEEKTN